MPVISWLLRPILFVAAIIAGWFVAEDSANFGIVQLVISVLLITGLVAIVTFWGTITAWFRDSRGE